MIPAAQPDGAPREYVIAPFDSISVLVFQEPDLSIQNIRVDASGDVSYPLLGTVRAAGKTSAELGRDLAAGLGRYLVRPQVSVSVAAVSQRITVEGSVGQPGVYEIRGTSSLLEAMALARSPSNVAALDQILVFRVVNGERTGARFDLRRIRNGIDPDPEILGGDRIVVGFSALRGAWRDFLSAVPVVNVFSRF
jgi:polysaccharide export outer membrane protein